MINFAIKNFSTKNTHTDRMIDKAKKALSLYDKRFKNVSVNFFVKNSHLYCRVGVEGYQKILIDAISLNRDYEDTTNTLRYWLAMTHIVNEIAAKWKYAQYLYPGANIVKYFDEAMEMNSFVTPSQVMAKISDSFEKWEYYNSYDCFMIAIDGDDGITSTATAIYNVVKAIR
ncbi:hypothetical protein CPT_Muldoon_003 [Serratia phage Muldoon]|uniref:Uncharacterized protein n=1 Tax=Serratia phage Muldoon TaxID=2601678 RepID=A0A5P8PIT7_9CAUD|nr:hypothetical protein HYP94_gp003 [Serratia phage Muldoon]QFR55960.1 hypothetical protein CPT_Muldoon_003 [Serratia phage Muldoon]